LGFITVTDVELSDDLRIARVFVSVLKTEDREITLQILNNSKGFIRTGDCKEIKNKNRNRRSLRKILSFWR